MLKKASVNTSMVFPKSSTCIDSIDQINLSDDCLFTYEARKLSNPKILSKMEISEAIDRDIPDSCSSSHTLSDTDEISQDNLSDMCAEKKQELNENTELSYIGEVHKLVKHNKSSCISVQNYFDTKPIET